MRSVFEQVFGWLLALVVVLILHAAPASAQACTCATVAATSELSVLVIV